MKKMKSMKMFIMGLIVGMMLVGTTVLAANAISSAIFNDNIVIFNGQTLELNQPLMSVVLEGETSFRNYMPVRAVLEAMGYIVDWDGVNNAVIVSSPVAAGTGEGAWQDEGLVFAFDFWRSLDIQNVVEMFHMETNTMYVFAWSDIMDTPYRTVEDARNAGISPLVVLPFTVMYDRSFVNEAEALRILIDAGLIE